MAVQKSTVRSYSPCPLVDRSKFTILTLNIWQENEETMSALGIGIEDNDDASKLSSSVSTSDCDFYPSSKMCLGGDEKSCRFSTDDIKHSRLPINPKCQNNIPPLAIIGQSSHSATSLHTSERRHQRRKNLENDLEHSRIGYIRDTRISHNLYRPRPRLAPEFFQKDHLIHRIGALPTQ
jgi:hypothetical protein